MINAALTVWYPKRSGWDETSLYLPHDKLFRLAPNRVSLPKKSFSALLLGSLSLHTHTTTMPDREHGISGLETDDDDRKLESLGYVPSFKREFSNLATVRGLFPFFRLHFLMGDRFLHRLALPLALWCALPYLLCDHSYTNYLIGSLLFSRHHVQYPAALGGPFVSTSTNTYSSSMIPSIGVLLIGDLVLDSWSNHVFHFRWAVPLSAPPYPLSLVTGSSIAEIVSAFPTCGGLCVSLRHILAPVRLIRSSDRYTASAQLVPKKHRPIVSTFSDRPSRARTHDIGGRLGCGLAQHPWPSCRSVFYGIWSLKHDLGCHCRRQRWQLPSHLWQGRRSLRRVIDLPRYPGKLHLGHARLMEFCPP